MACNAMKRAKTSQAASEPEGHAWIGQHGLAISSLPDTVAGWQREQALLIVVMHLSPPPPPPLHVNDAVRQMLCYEQVEECGHSYLM